VPTNYERVKAYRERKAAEDQTFYRRRTLWERYRISLEDWYALLDAQGNVCAICGTDDPGNKHGWHTDHDPITGVVRGLLCRSCNQGLGKFSDDPERLVRAADYLRRFGADDSIEGRRCAR